MAPQRWGLGHALARVAIVALVVAPLAAVGSSTPASAATLAFHVSASGGGQVIAGNNATYSISATNDETASDGFNLALYLDVPDGVDFVSSTLGAPVIYGHADIATIPVGTYRWVWEDVSDLPASGSFGGTVVVHPSQPTPAFNDGTHETSDTTVFPVGSSFNVRATPP